MHRHRLAPSRTPIRIAIVAGLVGLAVAGAATAQDAEVVSLLGRGEAKETTQADWRLARIAQRLRGGAFVRTGDLSQMALLLHDQTQLRINQNSLVQIKEASAGAPTRIDLQAGRAWMQSKAVAPRPAGAAHSVIVETPTATAAIRGTDWEMGVDEKGVTLLTVLSGEVEFFNEFGSILVLRDEQALAEPGKAPVKVILTRARDRVQWVTAYRAQPARWMRTRTPELDGLAASIEAGQLAQAAPVLRAGAAGSVEHLVLLADLLLSRGNLTQALPLLEEGQRRFPAEGRLSALLARAYVIADRANDAAVLLRTAQQAHGQEVEVWLAAGDLARFEGDEHAANAAYRRALAIDPDNAQAWFGLGVVATEREDVRPARHALDEALRRDPRGPGFLGELGTLETFSDRLGAGREAFDAALAMQPDDYVALTGLGVLLLKRGDPEAALEVLLKAGLLEPRYARAALYTGVAHYQLGRRESAIERFRRAADLDPKDPLPHLMLSVVAYDHLAWGDAVAASREAVERMPYLKSLNQLLNNQKGYAGVGSAVAAFGLDEWAQAYAYDAYTPYWAGSHLFLADRLEGQFNKNSELFQGFLTDPTVFGASNRFSTLVPRPGDYVSLIGTIARQDFKAAEAQVALNGYRNDTLPLAYYLSLDGFKFEPIGEGIDGNNGVATVGVGARPTHDVGLFLFGTRTRTRVTFADSALGLPGNPVTLDSSRVDAGVNLKFAPENQAWIKVGGGRDTSTLSGTLFVTSEGERLETDVESFRSRTRSDDVQWRHTVDVTPRHQLSWGAEWGRQSNPTSVLVTTAAEVGIAEQSTTELRSQLVYVSNRFRPARDWQLQADVSWHKLRKRHEREDSLVLAGEAPVPFEQVADDRDIDEIDGSVGVAWRMQPTQVLRLAWQQWRRPASVSTLAPVDTLGIPLDDRLVTAGGRLQRVRGQFEWEFTPRTFGQAYADWKRVDNVTNPAGALLPDVELTDLERLRNLIDINLSSADFYEDDPEFGAGRIKAAGFALNHIFTPELSAAFRYHYHEGRNTTEAFQGNAIPYVPRHMAQVGVTWVALPRLQLSGVATYRTHRYQDEANLEPLANGWNVGVGAYWETDDKRFAIGAAAENLLSRNEAGNPHKPLIGVQVIWRQ